MIYVNMFSGANPGSPYTNLGTSVTTPVELTADWSVSYVTGQVPSQGSANIGPWPLSGSADWITSEFAATTGHASDSTTNWVAILLYGPPNQSIRLETYSGGPSGRVTAWRAAGNVIELANDAGNATAIFEGSTDNNGEFLLEFRRADSSGGMAYASLFRFEETASTAPSLTITSTTPITPGSTVTGTYENFNVVPTGATFSDGVEGEVGVNTLSTATAGQLTAFGVTNTDTAGVHSGTFSFVTPSLPTSGSRQTNKFTTAARVRLF